VNELMVSVSGVRGIVGKSLTPELLTRFAAAFGTYVHGGTVVVGRDTRTSGAMIKHSVFAGLMSAGCRIIDLDIATTPTCSLMVVRRKASGGLVISGSHNPIEWNALKFLRSDGIFLNENQARMFLDIYYQGQFRKVDWTDLQDVEDDRTGNDYHIGRILDNVNLDIIRRRRIKVVVDACNGAGSVVTPQLLGALGCQVVKVHCTPNGLFPHNPEPVFTNLADLCKTVKRVKADIGFAQDADADRLAIVSEKGDYIGEEYSLALVALHILKKRRGPVVTNLSTSRMIDDVAGKFGVEVIRTKVGEVNVAEKMKETGSVIGGEGNGGVMDPRVHLARDSLVAIALILECLAETGLTLSRLAASLPSYHMIKKKVDCSRDFAYEVIERIRRHYRRQKLDLRDGVRVDWRRKWLHVRPSGTEPALRIIAEGRTSREARALVDEALSMVRRG